MVVRFVSQFTWNDETRFSETTRLVLKLFRLVRITRRLLGLKKYVPSEVPALYPSIQSDVFWQFTGRSFRAVFYYFCVTAICGLSRLVDEMGEEVVAGLQEAERNEAVEEDTLKVQMDSCYDEVYRLSTLVMHGIYKQREEEIQHELEELHKDESPVENESSDEERGDAYSEEYSEGVLSYSDEEQGESKTEQPVRKPSQNPSQNRAFLLRLFNRYVEAHDIPTPHIFWLKLRKNNLLFVYELIHFVNHNLLDILRLINIGMMTIACVLRRGA